MSRFFSFVLVSIQSTLCCSFWHAHLSHLGAVFYKPTHKHKVSLGEEKEYMPTQAPQRCFCQQRAILFLQTVVHKSKGRLYLEKHASLVTCISRPHSTWTWRSPLHRKTTIEQINHCSCSVTASSAGGFFVGLLWHSGSGNVTFFCFLNVTGKLGLP